MAVKPLLSLYLFFCPLAVIFSSPHVKANYKLDIVANPMAGIINSALTGLQLIQSTCKSTSHSELCEAKLKADPNSQNADLKGLATIMLTAANMTATTILEQINKLQDSSDNTTTENGLLACSEHYYDAIDHLEDSITAVQSNSFSDLNTWVMAAVRDANSCQEEFAAQPGLVSPLTDQNQEFANICNVALAMTKQLSASG